MDLDVYEMAGRT